MTPEWFAPYRTLRADMMKVDRDHDRLYLKAGNGVFGSYRLSTFTSRAAAGPFAIGPRGEQYLPFEMSVNPEAPASGWHTVAQDGAERFLDFDFDSRGYIYLAYTLFGWGIVDQSGRLIHQTPYVPGDIRPSRILTLAVEGRQYAVISNGISGSVVYDVTDPRSVERIRVLPFGVWSYGKNAEEDEIAVVVSSGVALRIYSAAALITGGSPLYDLPPNTNYTFAKVTSDGTKFYAAQRRTGSLIISTVSPIPGGYVNAAMPERQNSSFIDLSFESGFLTLLDFIDGQIAGTLYRSTGSELIGTDITSYLRLNYPFAGPVQARQILPVCTSDGTFAAFQFRGLGEVFSLTPGICPPGAPTDISATASDASATVSFSPPPSDGGGTINSYVVTSYPGGMTASGATSPLTMTGLTNGVTYTFRVKAVNAGGVGPSSLPSNGATPNATLEPSVGVIATAATSAQVVVTWAAAGGAIGYDLLRSSHAGPFSVIATPSGPSYVDNAVSADTTYLYSVRSIGSGDTQSSESAVDAATTVIFIDDPLAAGMTIRAMHGDQIRLAVNAMRAAADLSPATFTDTTLVGATIKAVHLTELRAALDTARIALSLSPLNYGQPSINPGLWVMASHFQELRNGVK